MTRLQIAGLFAVAFVSVLATFAQNEATATTPITALASDVPATCPITKSPVHPFVPPAPYPQTMRVGGFWFGKPSLWTALLTNGTWDHLPHYSANDPTFRQKLFWWRQGYDWHKEPEPKLNVTGRRLDGPAPPLLADHANAGWQRREQPFIVVGINLPTLGCWEITGRYGDDKLTFVVWVTE